MAKKWKHFYDQCVNTDAHKEKNAVANNIYFAITGMSNKCKYDLPDSESTTSFLLKVYDMSRPPIFLSNVTQFLKACNFRF